jgi:CRISPR/Cas system CSM-associated protein Csm3 (group 7 of RAMP superfamily)
MVTNNRNQDRIVGKVILRATLTNESPLLIGRGGGDAVDIEAMSLPEPDGRPYIPASSIAGCLRSFTNAKDGYFWGKTGKGVKNPLQSHIRFDDLIPESTSSGDVVMRDGVKIDYQTGTAEDKKKYDYQVVEPGLSFPFYAEITLRDSMKGDVKGFVEEIKATLESPHFRIGANTNTGFGKMNCKGFKAFHFNFLEFPDHADAWFSYIENGSISIPELPIKVDPSQLGDGSFSIEAIFRLKSSLMIGAYGIKGNEPDKSQLKSRDRHVLPGKPIRGAIRHRAVKIWKIMGKSEEAFLDLFGHVSEDEKLQIRSRLRVEEFLFQKDEVKPMVQNRIRIDRFTGGVIDGALFNSEPVWTSGEEQVKLTFTILKGASPDEKKLLLMLLKDLWLEDLAIGGEKNVGRGILIGQEATIYNGGKKIAAFNRDGNGPELEFTQGSVAEINQVTNPQNAKA